MATAFSDWQFPGRANANTFVANAAQLPSNGPTRAQSGMGWSHSLFGVIVALGRMDFPGLAARIRFTKTQWVYGAADRSSDPASAATADSISMVWVSLFELSVGTLPSRSTTSMPAETRPKIVCLPAAERSGSEGRRAWGWKGENA